MKLVNFASIDPNHQARGVKGLRGSSRHDKQVWEEFDGNWDEMTILSETELHNLQTPLTRVDSDMLNNEPEHDTNVQTDTLATIRVRTMQSFFRKVVLAAYNCRCCVTGNPVEDLLVASHILPWSSFPQHRLNPRNGLCLAAHFDRAFDRGLVTFDGGLRLLISPVLKLHLPNAALDAEFATREGQPVFSRAVSTRTRFPCTSPQSYFQAELAGDLQFHALD